MRRAFLLSYTSTAMDAGPKFVMLAPILPLVVVGAMFARPPWTPMRIGGLALFVISFVLLTWARWKLGNSFSITPKAKALVTHGVYSKVRHPVYVFSALLILGLILYVDKLWLLLLFAVVIPMQVARARAEEKILTGRFGEEYVAYKKTSWF